MNYRHAESFIGLMALMVVVGAAQAENRTWPATVVSLEGNDWKVAADPKNAGRDEAWWKGPVDGRQAGPRAGHLAGGAARLSRRGLVLARVHARPRTPIADGRCLLRFHAVDYLAEVWVNDVPVGGHEGGETPFTLDITERGEARRDEPAGGAGAESEGGADRRHRAGRNAASEQGPGGHWRRRFLQQRRHHRAGGGLLDSGRAH